MRRWHKRCAMGRAAVGSLRDSISRSHAWFETRIGLGWSWRCGEPIYGSDDDREAAARSQGSERWMTNSGELSMMLRSTNMHKSTIGGFLTLLRSFGRSPRQHNSNNEGDRQWRCCARVWSSSGGAGALRLDAKRIGRRGGGDFIGDRGGLGLRVHGQGQGCSSGARHARVRLELGGRAEVGMMAGPNVLATGKRGDVLGRTGPLASGPLRSLLGCAMRIRPGQNNIARRMEEPGGLRWTSKGVPRRRERVGEGEK